MRRVNDTMRPAQLSPAFSFGPAATRSATKSPRFARTALPRSRSARSSAGTAKRKKRAEPLLLQDDVVGGVRLFEDLDPKGIELRRTSSIETPSATHLRFRIIK